MAEEKSTPRFPAGLYRRPRTKIIWCKYYVAGRPVRESTETSRLRDANGS
jgi:hypothetical protein